MRSPTPSPTLTADQIDQLRAELERTLRRLERSIKNGDGAAAQIDQSTVGRLSRAEALQNQGLTRNLHQRERTRLDEVLQALGRLDDGSYGRCASCRAEIAFERLFVFPEARTCAGCGDRR